FGFEVFSELEPTISCHPDPSAISGIRIATFQTGEIFFMPSRLLRANEAFCRKAWQLFDGLTLGCLTGK
ncbi:MAG: hypothetical protein ACXAEI_10510, partial [Candidatus Hodarchaeales archaeon]